MSSEQEQIRSIAERIARRVSQSKAERKPARIESGTLSARTGVMRAGLDEHPAPARALESHITHDEAETSQRRRRRRDVEQGSAQQQCRQSRLSGATRSPWLSGTYVPARRIRARSDSALNEAAVSELVDFFEREKKCAARTRRQTLRPLRDVQLARVLRASGFKCEAPRVERDAVDV